MTLRTRLRRTAAADRFKRAHADAKIVRAEHPTVHYREAFIFALYTQAQGESGYAARTSTLIEQAIVWAEHVRGTGSRMDVDAKAAAALRFSLRHELEGLNVPTKLVEVAPNGGAIARLGRRLAAQGPFLTLQQRPVVDGVEVYDGFDLLGRIDPKHVRWMGPLPRLRVAAVLVTGGTETAPTRGLNVALEVWRVLPPSDPAPPDPAPPDPVIDAAAAEAAEVADARHLYCSAPSWESLGGWAQ